MRFIEQHEKDVAEMSVLKARISLNECIVKEYDKEVEDLRKKISEISEKYKISEVKNQILQDNNRIKALNDSFYILFLHAIMEIEEKMENDDISFDIESFLDKRGIEYTCDYCTDVDGAVYDDLSIYSDDDWDDVKYFMSFDRAFYPEEFQKVLDELVSVIKCKGIYASIVSRKQTKALKEVLEKYGIELLDHTYYSEIELVEEGEYLHVFASGTEKEILRLPEFTDFDILKEKLRCEFEVLDNIEERENEYKEYLRLKKMFEVSE